MFRELRLTVPLLDMRQDFLVHKPTHGLPNELFLIAQQRVDFHVVDTVKGKHRHPLRPVL